MKILTVILSAFVFAACSGKSPDDQRQASGTAAPAAQDNIALVASVDAPAGESAPNFTWRDKDGNTVSFAEVTKGKPVLVNFWATWCGPCIKETPDLVELNEEFSAKGAMVIGISADRGDDAFALVSEFTQKFKVTYPIIIDNGDIEEAFGGLRGYPTTFYIDKQGKIVKKLIGLQSKQKFSDEFNALL